MKKTQYALKSAHCVLLFSVVKSHESFSTVIIKLPNNPELVR
ncbi:hypothetical protein ABIC55_000698 [Sporosarcina psychrophila]|uniref:Uncharacterized protein n=1 Tax=Sporosarcina psychrophila TaxID=1476 RepID=A0ABV2K3F7_SPOPS